MADERVATGIEGLDQLLDGGFVKNTANIVSGTPGAGKTILALQFLVNGAKAGERGIYVTLEEDMEDINRFVSKFNWGLMDLAKEGKITLNQFKIAPIQLQSIEGVTGTMKKYKPTEPPTILDLYYAIRDEIQKGGYSRIVVDSITLLKHMAASEKEGRAEMASLFRFLKANHVTSVFTMERPTPDETFQFEDFLGDSIIMLRDFPSREERKRGITVLKMRGANADRTTRPYFISEKGITVYPSEHML